MSRRAWTLIAVVIVLGGIIGAYFWISRPKPAPVTSTGGRIELSKGDKEKISRIVLTNRAEGTLTLQKKDGKWTTDPPMPGTMDTSNLDDLLYSFSSLVADRTIEDNPTDLSKYGLNPPRATAIGTWEDGISRTMYLGNKTDAGNTYYLQVKGDPKVYTVWMNNGQHYHWTVKDLRSKAITPAINYDEITYMKLQLRDGSVLELKQKTAEESKSYQLGFSQFIITQPFRTPRGLDSEQQDKVIKGTQSISIADFVEDNPKDLSPYGLARPRGEAVVRDKANTIDFIFGAEKGTQIYFMIRGQPTVYLTDTSSVSFLELKPFSVIDKFTFIPNIDDVDRLDVTTGGKTHALTITRTTKKAEKAGDPDEVVAAYAADAKTLEEDNFKKFYQAVIGLQVEGEVTRTVSGEPEVTVKFTLNKGAQKTVRVDYVTYDRDFDAIFLNGVSEFALTKGQLTRMLGKLDTLLKGDKVTD
jgi:hypothetical protein